MKLAGGGVQARIEALGQALLRRCQEGGVSALGVIHLRGRKARVAADAYEEHLVLHGDVVALLTNRRLLCLRAPGFAAVHARAEATSTPIPMSSVPVGELKWAVEWQVKSAAQLVYASWACCCALGICPSGINLAEEYAHLLRAGCMALDLCLCQECACV